MVVQLNPSQYKEIMMKSSMNDRLIDFLTIVEDSVNKFSAEWFILFTYFILGNIHYWGNSLLFLFHISSIVLAMFLFDRKDK